MRISSRLLPSLIFLSLSLGSLAAQDVELVVTATKEPVPVQSLPVGVTILDGADLTDKATVAEALESTLAVRTSGLTPGQPALGAPGFGENGFGRIGFLVDGVSQTNPDMSAPPLDLVPVFALERIEVLKGPGSALYGDGALAGAVNLVTKVPGRFEAEVSTALESTLSNRQSLAFGLPVGEGGLLLSLQRTQNLPTRDRSDSDQYQLWTKVSWPVLGGGADQDWSVWGSAARASGQMPGPLDAAQNRDTPDLAVNQGDETVRNESKGGFSWSASGDGWSASVPLALSYRAVRSTTKSWSVYTDTGLTQWSLEPRAKAGLGDWAGAAWNWSGGLGTAGSRFDVAKFPDAGFSTANLKAAVSRWTGFGWTRVEGVWADRWFASASLRVEGARTEAVSADKPSLDGQRDFWPVSGDLGLTWLPAPGWKAGVQVSRVFRYPAVDEMIYYAGFWPYTFDTGVDPETGHGASASLGWSAGAWKLEASGTLVRMENEITVGSGRNVNSGPAWHGSGLATVQAAPDPSSALGLDYGYEYARYASGAHEGKIIPLVPAHRARFWGRWEWAGIVRVDGGWTLEAPYYTSGDYDNTQDPVPGRQSLDAGLQAALGSEDLVLRLFGKNLTGDRTPSYVNSSLDPVWGNYFSYYPSEGRSFGAVLTWKL